MSSAIEINDVTVVLEGRTALKDISLAIPRNCFSVIFGPNGSGKTTLLRLILGEILPTSGTLEILGGAPEIARKKIGYVSQWVVHKRGFPLTAHKAVLLGRCGVVGMFRKFGVADHQKASEALETVGLSGFEGRYLDSLSGGELQRVFLARALASDPEILLLDEATSGVDIGARETLYELLGRLKSKMCVVFVSHDVSIISDAVDQLVCLNVNLVSHGKPKDALSAHALKCMYGDQVALLSHCGMPHYHLENH